jgi:hypothetical protein
MLLFMCLIHWAVLSEYLTKLQNVINLVFCCYVGLLACLFVCLRLCVYARVCVSSCGFCGIYTVLLLQLAVALLN